MVSTPETFRNIVKMLGCSKTDHHGLADDAQESAFNTLKTFLEHGESQHHLHGSYLDHPKDDSRTCVSTEETYEMIITLLRDSDPGVRKSALMTLNAFLEHGESQKSSARRYSPSIRQFARVPRNTASITKGYHHAGGFRSWCSTIRGGDREGFPDAQ